MADPNPAEDLYQLPDNVYRFKLDPVKDFEGTNKNFDEISDAITLMIHNMSESNRNTNENIVRLAQETSNNLNKLTSDLKSVLSSQTMMCVLFVTVLGLIFLAAKSIWDAITGPIVY